jgi:hypothetical protein
MLKRGKPIARTGGQPAAAVSDCATGAGQAPAAACSELAHVGPRVYGPPRIGEYGTVLEDELCQACGVVLSVTSTRPEAWRPRKGSRNGEGTV